MYYNVPLFTGDIYLMTSMALEKYSYIMLSKYYTQILPIIESIP
jgi:hypothetical protein